jgi:hypothetical protein
MSAVFSNATSDKATEIDAVLNYTRKTGVRPVIYTFEPPAGLPRNSGETDARSVTIRDARMVKGLALDLNGFEMISHRSTLSDWRSFQDADRVKAIDYPEVARRSRRTPVPIR